MPNRILREGIVTSERVNSLDWDAEVFYRRLLSVVDDFGRYTANAKLLLGTCYALKLDVVSLVDINRWLGECQEADLLRVYEVSGKPFLEVIDFKQQIRSKESKYPAPDSGVPIECIAPATQLKSNAHLDGGVGVGEDGDGDGDVSGDGGGVGSVQQTRAVQIAVYLRTSGIDGANASNPLVDGWARNPKVTDDLLVTAVGMVKARNPTRPGPKYMAPIIEELLSPRPVGTAGRPAFTNARDESRKRAYEVLTGKTQADQSEVQPAEVINGHIKLIG
jgi:hypothetical protein